jgi:hypothetical protein
MKLSIKINTGGDDYIVETNLYHIIQLERKYKVKASDLANGISIEQLGFLAHEAAKTGNFAPPLQLDDFLKKLVTLDVLENEAANPTEGDQ